MLDCIWAFVYLVSFDLREPMGRLVRRITGNYNTLVKFASVWRSFPSGNESHAPPPESFLHWAIASERFFCAICSSRWMLLLTDTKDGTALSTSLNRTKDWVIPEGDKKQRVFVKEFMMMTGLGISIHCLQPQGSDNPLICSLHRLFKKNIPKI